MLQHHSSQSVLPVLKQTTQPLRIPNRKRKATDTVTSIGNRSKHHLEHGTKHHLINCCQRCHLLAQFLLSAITATRTNQLSDNGNLLKLRHSVPQNASTHHAFQFTCSTHVASVPLHLHTLASQHRDASCCTCYCGHKPCC